MKRFDLLRSIRGDGARFVERYLPADAEVELERLIDERRYEVDASAFRMFASIRARLSEGGAEDGETAREAGEIMVLLSTESD
ncbi:hypothetical protein WT60_26345 [Burkholderia sp. MSMB617WGS]|uniref:hypothetical protein n=1 Tax=Burkholderia TaxID=32008 RepID=UPI0007600BB7|nr:MULTISPECIES: hypothetical protein [Burkholderia]AOK50342.1 hypothetical protein WT60_26345 [Burkholderia sp. MSMB617WGS]KWZ47370.1 hypothetical protein WS73_01910 [Burkholderia savannae]